MITVKEIAEKTMTPEKRETAKFDLIAFYIGRPLSYVLTIPFLYTSLTPNAVSLLSIVPIAAGFVLACVARTKGIMLLAWGMFFLWNLMDGVDGNMARYRKQFSKMGSVYDSMTGYLAAAFTFFAAGVMAAHAPGFLTDRGIIAPETLIILGGTAALFNMFPRLVMHKAITTLKTDENAREISDKKHYGFVQIVALNLKSCAGGAQALFLAAILLNILDLFTVAYFAFNALVMIGSVRSVLKGA